MFSPVFSAGLILRSDMVPPAAEGCVAAFTEEAALTPCSGEDLRVEPLVSEDQIVAQGQPLLRLRTDPSISLVAPMAGRIASIELKPGRRLTQLVLFREVDGGQHRFETVGADGNVAALRALMQGAGLWRALRSRPFGKMPGADEEPDAIFVMALDTRPEAPDPNLALEGREEEFGRGLAALTQLAKDGLRLCSRATKPYDGPSPECIGHIRCGGLHPNGLAGIQIHRHHPATIEAPVWDIHAEDVADLGALLATGYLPGKRLVSVTGAALRETQQVWCQPGADLRGLSRPMVRPGLHEVLSGSQLDGRAAHWLAPRDRQVTVLPRSAALPRRHWFGAALEDAARHRPIIPTAALDQAMGGGLPAAALIRALGSGDQEAAVRLGVLSFVEEDLALADYATGARPRLAAQLRVMLDRIEAEEVPK